jgi:hypothetical protein
LYGNGYRLIGQRDNKRHRLVRKLFAKAKAETSY